MKDAPSRIPDTGASDIRAVTTAMTQLIENLLRSMVQETVPDLVKLQVEQTLKSLLPELVQRAIAQEQDLITESAQSIARDQLRETLPGSLDRIATPLIESEVRRLFEESAQQSVESATREMLPGLLNQIGPPLIENEVRRLMAESAQTIIEKVVWDVVPSQAELEVKKEIARLQAEP